MPPPLPVLLPPERQVMMENMECAWVGIGEAIHDANASSFYKTYRQVGGQTRERTIWGLPIEPIALTK